jgi:hypothetical protein
VSLDSLNNFFSLSSAANTLLHLPTFGAACSGHSTEKVILRNLVLFKSAAGVPFGENQPNH